MRRRSKRGPNDSESTGKTGQSVRSDGPAPLKPSYSYGAPSAPESDDIETGDSQAVIPAPVAEGKLEVETQPESPMTPAATVVEKQQAQGEPKGYVVLTIGLPGSGKSTWYRRHGVQPLSSDMLRTILFDDITDQRYSGLVFSTLRSLLRARLIAKMPWNYVDATNLSAHERRQWIKMAKSFGYHVHAVFFDVPYEICADRNSKRDRRVSDEVMQKMAERLKAPTFAEGFSKITVVRVKGASGTTPAIADSSANGTAQQPEPEV